MQASVIICSYNRYKSLSDTLMSLADMVVPENLSWEVLIVDNNSTDATRAIAQSWVDSGSDRFRYVHEKKQGKSHALNTAIGQAKGDILLFTDDDCIVDTNWMPSIISEYDADPDLSVLGGRVELYDKRDRPITFSPYPDRSLFTPDRLFFYPLVIGSNMAIRRRVFDEIGPFDTELGPGSSGKAAVDSDIVYRAYRKGFKVAYSPDVLVYHNHGRRTTEEVEALQQRYWIGRGAFYCKHILSGDIAVAKLAYWNLTSILGAVLSKTRKRQPTVYPRRMLKGILKGAACRFSHTFTHGLNGNGNGYKQQSTSYAGN